jgi:hypothetical protein
MEDLRLARASVAAMYQKQSFLMLANKAILRSSQVLPSRRLGE